MAVEPSLVGATLKQAVIPLIPKVDTFGQMVSGTWGFGGMMRLPAGLREGDRKESRLAGYSGGLHRPESLGHAEHMFTGFHR